MDTKTKTNISMRNTLIILLLFTAAAFAIQQKDIVSSFFAYETRLERSRERQEQRKEQRKERQRRFSERSFSFEPERKEPEQKEPKLEEPNLIAIIEKERAQRVNELTERINTVLDLAMENQRKITKKIQDDRNERFFAPKPDKEKTHGAYSYSIGDQGVNTTFQVFGGSNEVVVTSGSVRFHGWRTLSIGNRTIIPSTSNLYVYVEVDPEAGTIDIKQSESEPLTLSTKLKLPLATCSVSDNTYFVVQVLHQGDFNFDLPIR